LHRCSIAKVPGHHNDKKKQVKGCVSAKGDLFIRQEEQMQIRRLQDTEQPTALKMLVYGQAGAGKTSLIKSLEGSVLIASAEAGLLPLRGFKSDVADIGTIADLREVHRILRETKHPYNWVCLDSLSEIAEVVLAEEKSRTKDPRQAYGAVIEQTIAVCKAFRDLPNVGVYFSAKEERLKDEGTGRMLNVISMPGSKLSGQLPYLFDEVFRLVVVKDKDSGDVKRYLQTQPEPTSDAKDRSGKLDAYEVADLGAIVNKINNAGE
jgi:phage nucleotide-binding protein